MVRFQKRIKIAPGFNLNLSKSGIGMSVGPKGLKLSTGPSGSYLSTGIPGTGISNRQKIGVSQKSNSLNSRSAAAPDDQITRSVQFKLDTNEDGKIVALDVNGKQLDEELYKKIKRTEEYRNCVQDYYSKLYSNYQEETAPLTS